MTHQQQSVEELFGAALELSPEQRSGFLDDNCRNEPELRRLVEELLAEDERAGSFLASPIIDHTKKGDFDLQLTRDERVEALATIPPRFETSQLIANRFAVVRFIARGGMGEVYEVADRLLHDSRVALKVIRPEIAADAESTHRFEQEVILARRVVHPNLCPIYEIYHCEDPLPRFLFLTMKLLDGETLDTRLRRSRIPRADAFEICTGMVDGLAAIHAVGIIHRDIKPNNVMIERRSDRSSISIMDFGLARLHESENTVLNAGTVAGTPGYIAPELMQGHRPTQATDIFALGVVLHQVFTGVRPSESRNGFSVSPSPSLDRADAPPRLIQSVKDFLSDDPEQRCRAFEYLRIKTAPPNFAELLPHRNLQLPSRRTFLIGAGSAAACAAAGTAVWNRDALYDVLHPLPKKRFVALLDWPPPDSRIRPMLLGLIDAMSNELQRAEAFDHNFYVTTQGHAAEARSPTQLNEVRESLGANLVLAASGSAAADELSVALHVLDPASGRTLRSKQLTASADEQFSLPERVVRAAARLLDVAHYEPNDRRSQVGTENAEALDAFRSAEALIKQPNDSGLDAAIEKYRAAVDADHRYALAYARLAQAYVHLAITRLDSSSFTLARANAETALSLNPKLSAAHVALASVYQYTGELASALREFGVALSLDPADTLTMTYQAQLYERMDRWSDAEDTYKRVLRLRPNFWLAYSELGNTYAVQGNYLDALTAYRASAMVAPQRALTHNNVAVMLFQLGRFDEALRAVDQAIAIAPFDSAFQTRSDILRAQHRFPEALEAALQGAKLNAAEGANWLEVGDAYSLLPHGSKEALEAYKRAVEAQAKALEFNPKDGIGVMLLALYRVKSGQAEGAMDLVRKAEALGAADIYSQLSKVRILELLGRREDALSTLDTLRKRGVTLYQIAAVQDLDLLRTDPRFTGSHRADVSLPQTHA